MINCNKLSRFVSAVLIFVQEFAIVYCKFYSNKRIPFSFLGLFRQLSWMVSYFFLIIFWQMKVLMLIMLSMKTYLLLFLFLIVNLRLSETPAGFGIPVTFGCFWFSSSFNLINLKECSNGIVKVIVEFHCLSVHVRFYVDLNELLVNWEI